MKEKKYTVLEGNNILASNMNFDMALVFIKGYRDTYYNERINLTIREEDEDKCIIDNSYQE